MGNLTRGELAARAADPETRLARTAPPKQELLAAAVYSTTASDPKPNSFVTLSRVNFIHARQANSDLVQCIASKPDHRNHQLPCARGFPSTFAFALLLMAASPITQSDLPIGPRIAATRFNNSQDIGKESSGRGLY
jgi:hypothetical protein